jgi:hypothetical protein
VLFANLHQRRGREAYLSVVTFLERLAQMERGAEPFDEEGPAVWAVLQQRGLTAERVAEAWAQLDRISEVAAPHAEGLEAALAQERAAVDAMWAWYLEWSATARAAIQKKNLRRTWARAGRFLQFLWGPRSFTALTGPSQA